jgi:hypothetical protein
MHNARQVVRKRRLCGLKKARPLRGGNETDAGREDLLEPLPFIDKALDISAQGQNASAACLIRMTWSTQFFRDISLLCGGCAGWV